MLPDMDWKVICSQSTLPDVDWKAICSQREIGGAANKKNKKKKKEEGGARKGGEKDTRAGHTASRGVGSKERFTE